MIDLSYQNLFDIVQPSLPEQWNKIVFLFAFVKDTCEIMYFVQIDSSEFLDCLHIGQDKNDLLTNLSELYKEIESALEGIAREKRCSVITVVIEADGNTYADFDYTDISKNYDDYYESWLKKNIK